MSEAKTTKLTLTLVDRGGSSKFLGNGTIDASGLIEVTAPAPGQEAFVESIASELNARADVVLKRPPPAAEGAERFGVSKVRVRRHAPEFLAGLIEYTQRLYGVTLAFDLDAVRPAQRRRAMQIEQEDYGDAEPDEELESASQVPPVGLDEL
ncbi:MAG: hypothetical protein AAGA08_08385 [Pseudomonadota bacterium]